MFQSLIHQVSVSFMRKFMVIKYNGNMFQSLIHQVSVSFVRSPHLQHNGLSLGFNPLFIRSVFLFQQHFIPFPLGRVCFNPLFIRSVFLLQDIQKQLSSFTLKFQSLIHQVSVSFATSSTCLKEGRMKCFNPLFIRSVFLFMYIIYTYRNFRYKVSIPYSSGQCFF